MLSEVEASTCGTHTDPSTLLRMTKSKDCFLVPPRNDAEFNNETDIEKTKKSKKTPKKIASAKR